MVASPTYRTTEVGVIPGDWSVATIGTLADTSSGTTPSRALFDRYFRGGHIPWVKTLDLNNREITSTDERVTQRALLETGLRKYPAGSVLVAMYGGYNQIGRTGLLRMPACVNQALTAIRTDPRRLSPSYLLHVLNYRVEYWMTVASSSRKDPNITGRDVANFPLALPAALAEQEAIAAALDEVRQLIDYLDCLLAKKRQIKQGAMQELLTGARRLPGFTGHWQARRLGEIADITMGRTPSRLNAAFWGKGHTWLSIADLTSKIVTESKEEITPLAAAKMTRVAPGTLLMSFKLSIGRLCFAGCDLYTNEAICAFTNVLADVAFLYYALGRIDFSLYGKQAVKGITLNKESLRRVEVTLPPLPEQAEIACVLCDMDAEIDALEAKLTNYRRIKQGMMQELLTGRIRLV